MIVNQANQLRLSSFDATEEKIGLIAYVGVNRSARGKYAALALLVKTMVDMKSSGIEPVFIYWVVIQGLGIAVRFNSDMQAMQPDQQMESNCFGNRIVLVSVRSLRGADGDDLCFIYIPHCTFFQWFLVFDTSIPHHWKWTIS